MNCPYCDRGVSPVKTVYGWWYKCDDCNASVGCHPGTNKPLGTMAKPQLRQLRKEAHHYFDALWRGKMKRDNCSKAYARRAAYQWLAQELAIPKDECHIGMFDEDRCRQAIALCKPFFVSN